MLSQPAAATAAAATTAPPRITGARSGSSPGNAHRWNQLFNFWFDADAPPDAAIHSLELFKPGSPESVSFRLPIFADGFEAHNLVAWELP